MTAVGRGRNSWLLGTRGLLALLVHRKPRKRVSNTPARLVFALLVLVLIFLAPLIIINVSFCRTLTLAVAPERGRAALVVQRLIFALGL